MQGKLPLLPIDLARPGRGYRLLLIWGIDEIIL
jgi:hypothetical protein